MLIDTSGFLCLIHKDEREHADAVRLYAEASFYLTHSYILDEFVPLANSRKLPRSQSLKFSRQVLTDRHFEQEGFVRLLK